MGCRVRVPVAFSICQRHVSESHAASAAPLALILSKSWAPTAIPIGYFSFFIPYVPAIPQQSWSMSAARSPGTSAKRSIAGSPIPWERSWHGAWYGRSSSSRPATTSTAASRARSGQVPPARSAIATSGSQMSAARSSIPW